MSNIVERLGVLAASLANPQVAVDAQREIERLRAEVSSLEASPLSEEALDILRSDNARLSADLAAANALLREALGAIYTYSFNGVSLHARIRTALGDEQ